METASTGCRDDFIFLVRSGSSGRLRPVASNCGCRKTSEQGRPRASILVTSNIRSSAGLIWSTAPSTVQDHHAFDHRGQHGQELGAIFGEFIDLGLQLVRHVVERVRPRGRLRRATQVSIRTAWLPFASCCAAVAISDRGFVRLSSEPHTQRDGNQKCNPEGEGQVCACNLATSRSSVVIGNPSSRRQRAMRWFGLVETNGQIQRALTGGVTGAEIRSAPGGNGLLNSGLVQMVLKRGEDR